MRRKTIIIFSIFALCCLLFCGCHIKHKWNSATYDSPKKCEQCGVEEGYSISEEKIIGFWSVEYIKMNGDFYHQSQVGFGGSLWVEEDHTGTLAVDGDINDFTWEYEEHDTSSIAYAFVFGQAGRYAVLNFEDEEPLLAIQLDDEFVLFFKQEIKGVENE